MQTVERIIGARHESSLLVTDQELGMEARHFVPTVVFPAKHGRRGSRPPQPLQGVKAFLHAVSKNRSANTALTCFCDSPYKFGRTLREDVTHNHDLAASLFNHLDHCGECGAHW